MTLVRKSTLQSVSTDGRNIVIAETTGAYNVSTNPGGFGTPNPAIGSFELIILQLIDVAGGINYMTTSAAADFLGGSAFTVSGLLLPTPSYYPFKDGVVQVNSFACYALATVAGTAGNKFITGTLDTFLDATAIVDVTGNIYIIDKTQANTNSTIYLTTALMATITQARVAYLATTYALINAEFVCKLTNAIGSMAVACSEDEDSVPLSDLLVDKFAADFAFAAKDYVNADRAIKLGITKVNRLLNG